MINTSNKTVLFVILSVIILLLIFVGWDSYYRDTGVKPIDNGSDEEMQENIETPEATNVFAMPIADARGRVTKKPFGLYVEPNDSPVQGERFTGYHTAVDFEATSEQNETVAIFSICDGTILEKQIVGGYGGVIIQKCVLENRPVTVIYGHLNIEGEGNVSVGDNVKAGAPISILAEEGRLSGDERKHLHLGIHKGERIDYRGYVTEQDELQNWINFERYM